MLIIVVIVWLIMLLRIITLMITAWKVSKYGVFSGSCFPVFAVNAYLVQPNTGKYGPEKTPCLDTFHAVDGNNKK